MTAAGRAVVTLGAPPLRVSARYLRSNRDGTNDGLAVSLAGRVVAAKDADVVKVWSLDTGALVHRVEPIVRSHDFMNLLSPDGRLLAVQTGLSRDLAVYELGLGGNLTHRFTHKRTRPALFYGVANQLLVESGEFALLDTTTGKVLFAAVKWSPGPAGSGFGYAVDGTVALAVTNKGLYRWDGATDQTTVPIANQQWNKGAVAARALVAVVTDGTQLHRIDLRAATVTPINAQLRDDWGIPAYLRVSPSGTRVLMCEHPCQRLRVIDVATGRELHHVDLAFPAVALTYTDDDDVFGYATEGDWQIHVESITAGERRYPAPARFRGWLGPGRAAIEDRSVLAGAAVAADGRGGIDAAGAFTALDLDTLARTPLPATAVPTVAAPPNAPVAATTVAVGPDGTRVAADLASQSEKFAQCSPTLRVYTTGGGTRTLRLKPVSRRDVDTPGLPDIVRRNPCWRLSAGQVLAITLDQLTVYDPVTGKRRAQLTSGGRYSHTDVYRHDYYAAELSPDGGDLALVWRRPHVRPWAPPSGPDESGRDIICDDDPLVLGGCRMETVAEVWDLRGKRPRRRWRSRLDSHRAVDVYNERFELPLPKNGTTAIAFTHDGRHVLFGFIDGDILVRDVKTGAIVATEQLHRGPITRIELSPDSGHVFSEDNEGEQRIWPLTRP